MRKTAMTCLSMALLAGCFDEKPTLYVYNWMDYIDPDVIQSFEKEYKCKVVVDCFDDNEQAVNKLLAGVDGYDVMFPSSYVIDTLARHDLISKIDLKLLPNVVANFDGKYVRHLLSTNMEWSVPYAFSMTGYAYKTNSLPVGESMSTWLAVTNPALKGRVCILNDVRELIGISLKVNGFSVNSVNTAELDKAVKTARLLKSVAAKLDNVQYKSGLVSGEFTIGMGYNSDVLQIVQEEQESDIRFSIPNEGSTCCFDEMTVMKNSKNKDLAFKFINYMYRPDVAAKNSAYICTSMPNKGMLSLMNEDTRKMIDIPEDILSRLELIRDVGDKLSLYTAAWDRVKSTKD